MSLSLDEEKARKESMKKLIDQRVPMSFEEFGDLLDDHLKVMGRTLASKGRFYNRSSNRLQSFHDTGAAKDETPERALWGMLYKHITAVQHAIYALEDGILPDYHKLNESLLDMSTYPILLKALFQERKDVEQS